MKSQPDPTNDNAPRMDAQATAIDLGAVFVEAARAAGVDETGRDFYPELDRLLFGAGQATHHPLQEG